MDLPESASILNLKVAFSISCVPSKPEDMLCSKDCGVVSFLKVNSGVDYCKNYLVHSTRFHIFSDTLRDL